MPTARHPYELLIRWGADGALSGAHILWRHITRNDAGNVVAEAIGAAEPITPDTTVGTPFADLLDMALATALAQLAAVTAERDALAAQIGSGHAPEGHAPEGGEAAYRIAVQAALDAKARERRYADITAAVSYETSAVPHWAAEAVALRVWRDAVWVYVFGLLDAYQAGSIPQPSVAEVLAGLPAFEWPS